MSTESRRQRVTVSLPGEIVREIDRRSSNRSRFVQEAVENEIRRLRRQEFLVSIENPHPESLELADRGLEEWADRVAEAEAEYLVEGSRGRSVRWVAGKGWAPGAE